MYFKYTKTLGISDSDKNDVIKFGSLISAMADCEDFQFRNNSSFNDGFASKKTGVFVVARQTDFDISLFPRNKDEITCETWINEITQTRGCRNSLVTDKNGRIISKSYLVGAYVSLDSGRIVKIDKDFAESFKPLDKLDMEVLPRKIELPDTAPVKKRAIEIPRFFIDYYGHMNNVHYVRLAAEYVEDEHKIERLRVEYKIPAQQGDLLTPVVYGGDGRVTVTHMLGDKVSCVVEFTGAGVKPKI